MANCRDFFDIFWCHEPHSSLWFLCECSITYSIVRRHGPDVLRGQRHGKTYDVMVKGEDRVKELREEVERYIEVRRHRFDGKPMESGSRWTCRKLGVMGILHIMIYSDMYCVIIIYIYIINIIYIYICTYIYYITLCYVINMIYVQYTTWYIIYTYVVYYVWYVHDDNMINNDGLRKTRKSI